MKFNKWILGLALVGAMALSAQAQGAFDLFNRPRAVVLSGGFNTAIGTSFITNNPTDTRSMSGLAVVYVSAYTNTGTTGGTLTFKLQTSPDTNTWTDLGNLAVVNSINNTLVTNSANTNLIVNIPTLLPGTLTTPVAATSGLAAVKYLASLPYTNTGAITVPTANPLMLGFNIDDVPARYMRAVWTTGGSATNYTVGSAILVTLPSTYPF